MVKNIAIGLAGLVVVLLATAVVWMGPRNVIGWATYGRQAREGKLRVGDPAPDVALVALDGTTSTRLSTRFGDRPVVLVFGSFT
ncbi:MAG: hypothetical protein ACRDGR_07815 [bacterium]